MLVGMGKPFEVYVDIGGAAPIRFTITEDSLRSHPSLDVGAAITQHGPEDTDERVWLRRGAIETVRRMLEKNAADPVRIFDGPDVWVIPDHAVRAVRVHDPESQDKAGEATIGFRKPSPNPEPRQISRHDGRRLSSRETVG